MIRDRRSAHGQAIDQTASRQNVRQPRSSNRRPRSAERSAARRSPDLAQVPQSLTEAEVDPVIGLSLSASAADNRPGGPPRTAEPFGRHVSTLPATAASRVADGLVTACLTRVCTSVSGGGKTDSCGGRKSDSRQHGQAAG